MTTIQSNLNHYETFKMKIPTFFLSILFYLLSKCLMATILI